MDGLIHISELKNERVNKVTDAVELYRTYKAVLIKIDDNNKLGFSIKKLINLEKMETHKGDNN